MEVVGTEELASYVSQLMQVYRTQPADLLSAYAKFEPEQRQQPLAPGEWTPHQVVAHVVAAEREAFRPRLMRLLEEEQPRLLNWDEAAWMDTEYDADTDADQLLDWLAASRAELGERLAQLQTTEWNRSGLHPTQGERTLLWWLEYAVDHVRDHLGQLGE